MANPACCIQLTTTATTTSPAPAERATNCRHLSTQVPQQRRHPNNSPAAGAMARGALRLRDSTTTTAAANGDNDGSDDGDDSSDDTNDSNDNGDNGSKDGDDTTDGAGGDATTAGSDDDTAGFRPTALEALGAQVDPLLTERVDVVAIAPWEVPNWGIDVTYEGLADPNERKTYVNGLYTSRLSDYDFSQFGQWDGDSASYYPEDDQPPTPQVLPHLRPPTTSVFRQSPPPLHFPSPLTPVDFGGEEPVASTSGTQYEYVLTDIHGTPLSGLPSPITRPTTPIKEEEEEFSVEFDIRTQVAVRSTPHSPSPELVYPDPPSEPAPASRAVSAPPRVPSRTSIPPHIPTPDSPIDYERVAEQAPPVPHFEQENLAPAVPLFRPPSCLNSPEDHPHPYTTIYMLRSDSSVQTADLWGSDYPSISQGQSSQSALGLLSHVYGTDL
ncbi:hypothetical protein EDB84DRAFT_1561629 [Lactarius hengduanensis]|nr:hypothetical protein EDB84DRAFT_1561629 [Lactarius hengduanensis]